MDSAPTPDIEGPQETPPGGGTEVVVPQELATSSSPGSSRQETITEPAKLLRIASMVRELLEETRQASLDEPGRQRLAEVYERAIGELREVLSPDLQEELSSLAPPMETLPTESEIRVAQAQLVGWLEGLFHGIQAAMFAQQAAARAQFEELRKRGLPGGPPGAGQDPPSGSGTPGQYL